MQVFVTFINVNAFQVTYSLLSYITISTLANVSSRNIFTNLVVFAAHLFCTIDAFSLTLVYVVAVISSEPVVALTFPGAICINVLSIDVNRLHYLSCGM